jgi:signal transduction histidine kinase
MEYRLRAKDGTYRWIHAKGAAVEWNDAGQIVRLVGIHSDITEQKEAEERLRAYRERLRALAGELTATEERERRRIATVLHDGAAQSLAFARMQLAAVSKVLTDPAAAAQLDELSTLLKQSLQQVREILLDLSSPALNELGLGAALSEWLGQQVGERHGLETAFADASGDLRLTEDARALLFRNARELMTNAVKHAKARKVTLSMDRHAGAFRIRVQDDGVGFDPREAANRPGGHGAFGLFSIRERMADLGGSLEIVSRPGAGTEATLIAPLDRLT